MDEEAKGLPPEAFTYGDDFSIVLEKIDNAGRHVRQIELCDHHAQDVVDRERARGFEIFDRRDWR